MAHTVIYNIRLCLSRQLHILLRIYIYIYIKFTTQMANFNVGQCLFCLLARDGEYHVAFIFNTEKQNLLH